MGLIMSIGRVMTIAVAMASMMGLTDKELDKLKSYCTYNTNTWIAQRKHESEVEELVRSEAARIAKG